LESVRITGLIDGLLMLARVDSGNETLCFESIEVNQLIRQTGEEWKTSMLQALLDFHVELTPEPVFVSGDSDSLQRLLTILLDNALHYTQPGGTVNLRVAYEDNRVLFTVADTGIGIAPEHQSRVFDRFYRVDRTRGCTFRGAGLGLALARWIAEKHSTALSLESTLGRGSSFSFGLCAVNTAPRSNSDATEYSLSRS
jgi:signal transduction histidine kinase